MSRHVIRHAACVHRASLCCPCVVPELEKDGVGVLELHACPDYNSLSCCASSKFIPIVPASVSEYACVFLIKLFG